MYILAHRGFSFDYPENTILAFDKAVEAGAEAIEFDVQLNADGEAVVIHDFQLARLSTAHKHDAELTWVKDLSTEQFKSLDLGSHKGKKFKGTTPPLLSEVIERYHGKIFLDIEGKVCNHEDKKEVEALSNRIFELLPKNSHDQIMTTSYCPMFLERMRNLGPDLCLGGITDGLTEGFYLDLAKQLGLYAYIFEGTKPLDLNRIKQIKEAGLKAYAYTINVYELADEMQAAGVDGIFTDRVASMIRYLSDSNPEQKLA